MWIWVSEWNVITIFDQGEVGGDRKFQTVDIDKKEQSRKLLDYVMMMSDIACLRPFSFFWVCL